MTDPTSFDAREREAAKAQWQSYLDNKACCVEHAVKYAVLAGYRQGLRDMNEAAADQADNVRQRKAVSRDRAESEGLWQIVSYRQSGIETAREVEARIRALLPKEEPHGRT